MRAGWVLMFAMGCASNAPAGDDDEGGPDAAVPVEVADAATEPDPVIYPVPDWTTGTPAEHGLDVARLDEAAAVAEGNGSYCLLVIRHGRLVYERYFGGTDAGTQHKSWSLAKSYTGTLVGIAVDRGDLQLDQPVQDHIATWPGTGREAITVRHLISMTSGLEWSAFQDYVQMALFADDHTAFAEELAADQPAGSEWVYHNGGVQLLEPVFRDATGGTIEAYAQEHLWGPLGMTATWAHDPAGNATPYANVLASCRDHARLGYLYLHRGRWNGQQILSESWVAQATAPSQDFNRAYGYLFWLNGQTPAIDAMNNAWDGVMSPVSPPDLFAAHGFGVQFIDVIPSLDMVVVRFGEDPASGLDIGALTSDAHFGKHEDIMAPVFGAVIDGD
jgi:CubicO group peptidase (beta-lactamase class C family)